MAIVDTSVPITSQSCDRMIMELVRAYPFCRTEKLVTTAYGRPVRTLVMGTGPRKVIYTAAHHANEWITALVLLKYAEDLCSGVIPNAQQILDTATIYMVPMVNPDGVDLVVGAIAPGSEQYEAARRMSEFYPAIPFPEGWKANLKGVDLNLQYPALWRLAREIKFMQGYTRPGPRDYVGRAPLNQIESRALAGYTEYIDPALVLAYHTQGKVIYWQFADYEVPGARELGEEFARVSGYTLDETPYESSFAGYKDWFIQTFHKPGYTIEVGEGNNPLPLSQFDEIYRDNAGIMSTAALGS